MTLKFPFLVDREVMGLGREVVRVDARDETQARAIAISEAVRTFRGKGPVVIVHGVKRA